MVRTFATLILAFAMNAVSAQEMNIEVTEAMQAKATEKTALVERTVGGLNENQRAEVNAAYLDMEKYAAALDYRFSTQPAEVREADMPAQIANMDRFIEEKLATILTAEQLAAWQEASR